jgi:hypothetical protein
MAGNKNKTLETKGSVSVFLAALKDPVQKKDSKALAKLLKEVTKFPPKMWGSAIVGFGSVHYRYESGREGDTPLLGFSPRKGTLVIYGTGKAWDAALLKKLGKHATGKGCLYIKTLADIHPPALKKLLQTAAKLGKASQKAG